MIVIHSITSTTAWQTARAWLRNIDRVIEDRLLGTIVGCATEEPLVALTFDDGPHPTYTPQLLDILERYNARATFFVVGQLAREHPTIVRRVVEQGHAIANHTWDHPGMTLLSGAEQRRQLRSCAKELTPYGGTRLFRPPFGAQHRRSYLNTRLLGHQVVTWNVVVEDWLYRESAWFAEQLQQQIVPGCIVLLHDNLLSAPDQRAVDRSSVFEALEQTLIQLSGRFRFVTVPELLAHGRPITRKWIKLDAT